MNVCHYHFENDPFNDKLTKACAECQLENVFQAGKSQWEETIDPFQPFGVHITLVCDMDGSFWSTKNISFIGARSIFSMTISEAGLCDHSAAHLSVA